MDRPAERRTAVEGAGVATGHSYAVEEESVEPVRTPTCRTGRSGDAVPEDEAAAGVAGTEVAEGESGGCGVGGEADAAPEEAEPGVAGEGLPRDSAVKPLRVEPLSFG